MSGCNDTYVAFGGGEPLGGLVVAILVNYFRYCGKDVEIKRSLELEELPGYLLGYNFGALRQELWS